MDIWRIEKYSMTLLPEKDDVYSHRCYEVLLTQITHRQKEFGKIFKLGNYNDLYVESNTLLPADVFENFQNICLLIYKLDPARFLFAPGLA